MKKALVIFILVILGTLMNAEDFKKIIEKHKEALNIYKKTKNAKKALLIMRESGIDNIINTTPSDISNETFVNILNDYGFFISETENYLESIKILEKVKILSPDRAVIYLNIGDVYYKEYIKTKNEEYRVKMQESYEKYREKYNLGSIPKKIVERLHGELGLLLYEVLESNLKIPPENKIKYLKERKIGQINLNELKKEGIEFGEEPLRNWYDESIGLVDLDMDGEEEIVFYGVSGTDGDYNNSIYKKRKDGLYYRYLFFIGGNAHIKEFVEKFFRYNNETYYLLYTYNGYENISISKIDETDEMKPLIGLSGTKSLKKVSKNNSLEYRYIKNRIDLYIEEIENCRNSKKIARSKTENEVEGEEYLDINNDGVKERISKYAKLYSSTSVSDVRTLMIDVNGENILEDMEGNDILFERIKGKIYKLSFYKEELDNQYKIVISLDDKNGVRTIDEIEMIEGKKIIR